MQDSCLLRFSIASAGCPQGSDRFEADIILWEEEVIIGNWLIGEGK